MDLKFTENHCYRYDEASHVTPNSEIYKALDLTLNRTVALKKVIIQGNTPRERQENLKRAQQEVKTMVQIGELTAKLPNIYGTYYDEKENALFIVMQWINGETLADKIKRRVSLSMFLRWMQELSQILDVMSKKNFQHKDIKPENIIFNRNNDIYLIDFNISVSIPNQMEGTLYYKAPEMDYGSMTTARDKADMFSIGVMMYQFVTGRIPVRMVDYDCYEPNAGKWDFFKEVIVEKPDTSKNLNKTINKLMAYSPKDRYRNYSELINDLKKLSREAKCK